jgi:hypothetical protein
MTLAGKTVYQNGSIDTSFDPPPFSFNNQHISLLAVRYGTLIPCFLPLAIKLVMMTPIGWKDFLGVGEKDLWLPESLNKVWVRQVQRLLMGNKSFM